MFFPVAKARHGNASTLTCHHRAVSCLPCDEGRDIVWHLRWFAFFQTPAHGIITPSSIHFFLHLRVCGFFFFLIHVQQVPSIPKHVPRSFPMSAVKLKRDFLNLIDQVVTKLARSHLLDTNQIAAAESSCWVSSVKTDKSTTPDWASPGMFEGHRALSTTPSWELDLLLQLPLPAGSHNFPRYL